VVSYLPAPGVDPGWDDPSLALGPVTGDNFDIVSLGDLNSSQIAAGASAGQITLSFSRGIGNRAGADFAVFENSLGTSSTVFAELGYVEVSSDGTHFARFPSASLTPSAVGPYGSIDPTNVHNLAGKHVNAYGNSWGTPFDLSDLSADPLVQSKQVNLSGIRYVRIVDIPGDGSFKDSNNRPIYDAWLTFGSGGFDLEAIGVTHDWLGGDANLDGVVNAKDLGVLASHWQTAQSQFEQGDFDLSGFVDISDLYILAHNWQGNKSTLSATLASLGWPASVPEPVLVPLLAAGMLVCRRSSRHSSELKGKMHQSESGFEKAKSVIRGPQPCGMRSKPASSDLPSNQHGRVARVTKTVIGAIVAASLALTSSVALAETADLEGLPLSASGVHNDSSFSSHGALFSNHFTDFGGGFTGWEGFAYSNQTDTTTAGFGNQYSAIPGHGANNSTIYAISFVGSTAQPTITLPPGASPVSVDLTNTTYAYLSMRDGDPFAKKFGGASGNDPDFFKLTITGRDPTNAVVGTVDFYLADFRFANNAQDYLISDWTTVPLSALSGAQTLSFALTSSDNGVFGMNTPAYFAIDNVVFTPEPSLLGIAVLAGVVFGRRSR
jgi:hypothetical protein